MKRVLAAVLAVIATMVGMSAPAAAYTPDPADVSGTRFYTYSICVSDGNGLDKTYWPVAAIAQKWNVQSDYVLRLQYEVDCAAAGYPPSRRFFIGSAPGIAGCYDALYADKTLGTGGMYLWTKLYLRINTSPGFCGGTQAHRNHAISATIGAALGLRALNSSGWNSRVMNNTTYSWDNIQYPSAMEGDRVSELYLNWYGGI